MNYDNHDWTHCPTCNGVGTFMMWFSNVSGDIECLTCHGTKRIRASVCPNCRFLPRQCGCPVDKDCSRYGRSDPKSTDRGHKPCSGHMFVRFDGKGGFDRHCEYHKDAEGYEPAGGRTMGEIRKEAEKRKSLCHRESFTILSLTVRSSISPATTRSLRGRSSPLEKKLKVSLRNSFDRAVTLHSIR